MDFVKTLPVELTETIFFLVSEPPAFGRNSSAYINPLRLGAICQSWRYLAWSTPSLWSYIDLQSYSSCQDSQVEVLEAWLSRGNQGPLAVVFSCRSETTQSRAGEHSESYEQRLLSTLVRVSHRWRSIDLHIPNHEFYQTLNLAHHKVPHLEKVRFRTALHRSPCATFLEDATSLTHIIFDFRVNGIITSPHSFRNIKSLYFGRIFSVEFLPIISYSHLTLQHLYIRDPTMDALDVLTPLDFPNLKSLVLPWIDPNALRLLFASAPKLCKLDIKVTGRNIASKLEEFLLKVKASLRTLRLSWWFNGMGDVGDLEGVLICMLQLEALSDLGIQIFTRSPSEFAAVVPLIHEALTVAHNPSDGLDSPSKSLPHLQRYVFAETTSYSNNRQGISCIPILKMVESRVKAHKAGIIKQPLKEVVIGWIWEKDIKLNAEFFSDEVLDLVTVMKNESDRRNILATEWHLE